MKTIARPPITSDTLESLFREQGFTPGLPPQVSAATAKIDAATCRSMHCEMCEWRGLEFRPFHAGERYKVAAVCPNCQVASEV